MHNVPYCILIRSSCGKCELRSDGHSNQIIIENIQNKAIIARIHHLTTNAVLLG